MKKEFVLVFGVILVLGMLGGVGAVTLDVTFPESGGQYNEANVLFSLSTDVVSDFYYLELSGLQERWTRLCRDVTECEKIKRFSDGNNRILIKAVDRDGNANLSDEISFVIDSEKPRITRTYPKQNSLVNATQNFTIKYTEDNVKKITLFYSNGKSQEKITCKSGRNEECEFVVNDLSDQEGTEQEYRFEIEDNLGNKVNSSVNIQVDTTPPIKEYFDYVSDKRRVNFVFDINELNFKEISYKEGNDANPSWRKICSSLKDGLCSKGVNFSPGTHSLTIKAEDKAGNVKIIAENLDIATH